MKLPERKRPIDTSKEEDLKTRVNINKEIKKELSEQKVVKKSAIDVIQEVKIEKPDKQATTEQISKKVSEKKIIKEETKAITLAISTPPVKGQFKLNTLMSSVLEDELQDFVTQISKSLPNLNSSDMEKYIAERLKNGAFIELKNVLGLNITKRLLNVYNPLFVKIQFSCRPENGLLSKFLKNYNITRFKRIDRDSNTFAAILDTIADFDRICTARNIKCGSAKITVTPCYKFKKCPKNLNTVYNNTKDFDNYFDEDNAENNKNENLSSIIKKSSETEKNVSENQNTPKTEKLTPDKAKVGKPQEIKPKENDTNKNKTVNDKQIEAKTVKGETLANKINYENEVYQEVDEIDPELNDEMDDEEILALISGGVVLDECSGSDGE